jgi:predicted ATP-grasp superfamily ATP-dependent carboligase
MTTKPIGVLYEHPEWFVPLFAELERRGLRYERILAHEHAYDPGAAEAPFSLVVNRVSPSSYLRGHASAIFHALQYLAHLEGLSVPIVNGTRAYQLELSKARQLSLLASLGLPHPRSRVVNHVGQIEAAAAALEYPLIVKPNIGGSGALMRRFDAADELRQAVAAGELDGILGLDQTAIVQEYHPQRGGSIVRVEALDDRFLYAIRIHNDPGQGFNLCPADICQLPGQDGFDNCAVDAARAQRKIEVAQPPPWVVDGVLAVLREAGIDVGGVEYLQSERDGQLYLYDVNALSNFVTDAPTLVGFDPFARLVDYVEARAGIAVHAR